MTTRRQDAHNRPRRPQTPCAVSPASLTLPAALIVATLLAGCTAAPPREVRRDALVGPYPTRQVWAVAPLRNESGSRHASGVIAGDHLARQLETASNIDVVPIARVLKAMDRLNMADVTSSDDALQLLDILNVDGLVVGTITTYEPYDPPKLGVAVELYTRDAARPAGQDVSLRDLIRAPSGDAVNPSIAMPSDAASAVSGFFDAADPDVQAAMKRYADGRHEPEPAEAWRRYRISMDLYTEFVSYVVAWRLLNKEADRMDMAALTAAGP